MKKLHFNKTYGPHISKELRRRQHKMFCNKLISTRNKGINLLIRRETQNKNLEVIREVI